MSIIHIYSNKIFISLILSSLSRTQHNHIATIIKQPPSSSHSTQPYEIPKQIIKQIIKNGSKPKSHRFERQEGNGAPTRTRRILSQGLGSSNLIIESRPWIVGSWSTENHNFWRSMKHRNQQKLHPCQNSPILKLYL